jgi:hypothetical protein
MATKSAVKLGIRFKTEHQVNIFPRIKCLHNKKLYYRPTDIDYDMIDINLQAKDCYCMTIAEAEHMGFVWAHKGLV